MLFDEIDRVRDAKFTLTYTDLNCVGFSEDSISVTVNQSKTARTMPNWILDEFRKQRKRIEHALNLYHLEKDGQDHWREVSISQQKVIEQLEEQVDNLLKMQKGVTPDLPTNNSFAVW